MKNIKTRMPLPEEIEARVDTVTPTQFMPVFYITAPAAMGWCDEYLDGWSCHTTLPAKMEDGSFYAVCTLSAVFDGQTVTREGVGEGRTPKAAESDALKRAAVKMFPAIRALYRIPTQWIKAAKLGIQFKSDASNKEARKKELNDALKYRKFKVQSVSFKRGATGIFVKSLNLVDEETGLVVLEYRADRTSLAAEESEESLSLKAKMIEAGVSEDQILAEYSKRFGVNSIEEIANTKNIRENVLKRLANTKKPAKKATKSSSVNDQLKGTKKKEEAEDA